MTFYYNENQPYAAAKLRKLIERGILPYGHVDTRSIVQVPAKDLWGYQQCHFFAGIGTWALALVYADWPKDTPIWTGSCPCQPFSIAQTGVGGFGDDRHLWPIWYELIKECGPKLIAGEQVASPDGLVWWDQVQDDLESSGYAAATASICAAGFGADHMRDRLYWVADAGSERTQGLRQRRGVSELRQRRAYSQVDLQSLLERPYAAGVDHPEPLIRGSSITSAERVGELQAYGNGLDFYTAIEFLTAVQDTLGSTENGTGHLEL